MIIFWIYACVSQFLKYFEGQNVSENGSGLRKPLESFAEVYFKDYTQNSTNVPKSKVKWNLCVQENN